MEEKDTKTVIVTWTEFHNYEAEIEIPKGLSEEQAIDWVTFWNHKWGMHLIDSYDMNTDWESFKLSDPE